MAPPKESEAKESSNTEPVDDSLPEVTSREVPTLSDINDEKNNGSSDESDEEDAKVMSQQQEFAQRRRVQNARFEVLSVPILHIMPARADRYTGSPTMPILTLLMAPQLGSLTCPMLSSPRLTSLPNKIWALAR